jgi:hypothetical protein
MREAGETQLAHIWESRKAVLQHILEKYKTCLRLPNTHRGSPLVFFFGGGG